MRDDASAEWWVDGAIALEFEGLRLELWSPGPGLCIATGHFFGEESFPYEQAVVEWRDAPWPELVACYGQPLQSLVALDNGEPLGCRFVFETGHFCVYGDNDETRWTCDPTPPWQTTLGETVLFARG